MRWGLIGASGYAAKSCAPGIAESDKAGLAAVLSSDRERARELAERYGADVATDDMAQFLAAPGLDVVWVATPTYLHREQTLAILKAGKHVLCEKPLAPSPEEAWEMVQAAREGNLVLAVGYQGRYMPGHRAMKERIEAGGIGEVTVARSYYGVHRPGPPPEWRQHRGSARWGALADIGSHHVDLLRMLVGEIVEARSLTGHQLGFETEDVAGATLRFDSGAVGTLAVTVNVWRQETRVEVHGTKGVGVAVDTNPANQGTVTIETDDGVEDITGHRDSPWTAQVDAVTSAASRETVAYATGEDGARNVEILAQLG